MKRCCSYAADRQTYQCNGLAEIKTLHLVADKFPQKIILSHRFHAFATTVRLKVLPMAMIASMIALSSESIGRLRMNDRSTLSVSIESV